MRQADVLLDALASTPADVSRVAARLAAAAAATRPSPHEWAAVEILAHLVDVEQRYYARLRRVLDGDRPVLPRIDPPARGYDRRQSCAALSDGFAEARGHTLAFLRSLPRGGWARVAVHEIVGTTRMAHLVRRLVEHDVAHLAQLVDTRNLVTTRGDVA